MTQAPVARAEGQIGFEITFGGQVYRLVGADPHTRKDGRLTALLRWSTFCPDCGVEFVTRSSSTPKSLNRRCDGCKRPGVPVGAGRPS